MNLISKTIMKNIKYCTPNLLFAFYFVILSVNGQVNKVIIDSDFPGGNIIVEDCKNNSTLYYEVTQDTISVKPDFRDTKPSWFYWSFRVSGSSSKTLYFKFPAKSIGSFGPAYSRDGGESWQWLYDSVQINHSSFKFKFDKSDDEVLFSMQIPYLQSHLNRFLSTHISSPYISIDTLTTSKKGRIIEQLVIRSPEHKTKYKMVITARHHACESMANYALEGLIESIINGDNNQMKWLRDNVEILIVPFMDKDGVQDGDPGKNRLPYDHNRDYAAESIYQSTKALRSKIPVWGEGILKVALDMHCPALVGKWHENIYFVGSKGKVAREQMRFVQILRKQHTGELRLNPNNSYLKYGTDWNTTENYLPGQLPFDRWCSSILEPGSLAITMEIPYSNNNGQKIIPSNARLFGKDLADAIASYLQEM